MSSMSMIGYKAEASKVRQQKTEHFVLR